MTLNDRFVQVTGYIDEKRHELILTPPTGTDSSPESSKSAKIIRHDLKTIRICSIDTKSQRLVCQAKRHFGLYIMSKEGYRKLYFMTHDQMLAALDLLLSVGQKFKSRADQYEVVETQPDTADVTVLDHQIVRHRLTREKFLLKVIPHDAPDYIRYQAKAEVQTL